MRPLSFLLFAWAAFLTGCGFLGFREMQPLPLLPAAELNSELQLTQRVNATVDGEEQTFIGAWAVSVERLDFVGLTLSGQRLLTLSYDDSGFSESYSPLLDETIPGRRILSQLQLAHWPRASIERALAETDWRLEFDASQRHLYYKETLILSIVTSGSVGDAYPVPATIRIESHVAPYRLEVETLQVVAR